MSPKYLFMRKEFIQKICYISSKKRPEAEVFFISKSIEITLLLFEDFLSNFMQNENADLYLFILSKGEEDFLSSIPRQADSIPSVLIAKEYNKKLVQQGLNLGMFDVLPYPSDADEMECQFFRFQRSWADSAHLNNMMKTLKESETKIVEKNTILETILDLLSHDTKNIFVSIHSLINELSETAVQGMLKDSVNALYKEMKEALGYLGHRKRILSILEIVQSVNVTGNRIPIELHKRISFSHCSRYVLFAECSPLFKNVVMNIVENALKYSPETEIVEVHIDRKGDTITITVADRGPGIPDKEKEHIFERYYRMKETETLAGTGRGLWITKNIIEKEGGKLFAADNNGGGSVFHIHIPAFVLKDESRGIKDLAQWFGLSTFQIEHKEAAMKTLFQLQDIHELRDLRSAVFCNLLEYLRKQRVDKEAEIFKDKMREFKRLNKGGRKVLIADDSLYVQYYLATFFVEMGFSISDYAGNGEEAVKLYQEFQPDLITLDCTMPLMSGPQAARKIYEIKKDAALIFITGLGEHPAFIQELSENFPGKKYIVLTKPFKKEELEKAVYKLLN